MDLRCHAKKHGTINDGVIEIKCKSRWCGVRPGVIVIHRWSTTTGEPLKDLRFKEPMRSKNAS